jgi:hypothetical protein
MQHPCTNCNGIVKKKVSAEELKKVLGNRRPSNMGVFSTTTDLIHLIRESNTTPEIQEQLIKTLIMNVITPDLLRNPTND